ncbi:MAG: putative bifunctional diguanylate cyclase/phosphodiesterase [Vulcanimicrobiaceae bacterium]
MDRPRLRPRTLRESIGTIVSAAAALLLAVMVANIYHLNGEAGGDLSTLKRERIATAYVLPLTDLLLDVERYRNSIAILKNPPAEPGLRGRIDRELAALRSRSRGAASLKISADLRALDSSWARARRDRYPTGDANERSVVGAIENLFAQIEATSGIEYDPNQDVQNVGDATFAKIPDAINEIYHSDLVAENAIAHLGMSINDRLYLGLLLSDSQSDFDLSSDDIAGILARHARASRVSRRRILRLERTAVAYTASGRAFRHLVDRAVLRVERPAVSAPEVRALVAAPIAHALALQEGLSTLLDRNLVRRTNIEKLRNRYLYLAVPLGFVLLAGVIMLAAEIAAKRGREALRRAQQESAMLAAELARQKAERALRLSEMQFRAVFDGAALGIAILDRTGAVLDSNHVFRSVFGENAASVLDGQEGEYAALMRGERDLFEFEQHVMTEAGLEVWTASTVSVVADDAGKPLFGICMFRDLTEIKRNERRVLHDMTHDAITGLPNRALFETKLRERFAGTREAAGAYFAVLSVDLDRFKDINDSLGHAAGDFVLAQVAQRLRASVDPGDTAARFGSDEFAVLVATLSDVAEVELAARRIVANLAKPLAIGNRFIFVSVSVGIAVGSSTYDRAEDVVRDANIALRHAKLGGGSRFVTFDSKMHANAEKRLQLTTDLRLALERGEFHLVYQPIVKIDGGGLVGAEALLRWTHPTDGPIEPLAFVGLAEQTGMAPAIGRFVVRTACEQLARWRQGSGEARGFAMHVNASAGQIVDADFEATLVQAAHDFRIDPRDLTIEITENVILDSRMRPSAILERIRARGFKVCIDDFGTGYSSLRYLQQFRVDSIKIDRSFVAGSDGELASEPIVKTLMSLADAFEVYVVAEGVETPRQRDALRNLGCAYAQGYLYARPLTAADLTNMYPGAFGRSARATRA